MSKDTDPMDNLAYYLKISNHLAGKLDIRSALRSVKTEIDRILPLDHLDVCLIDEDNTWNTSYEVGMQTRWSSSRAVVAQSPVRDVLTGKYDSMVTGNAMKDPRYVFEGSLSEPIFQHQLKSRINVAMKVLGNTIGSLNCSSQSEDLYTDENVSQVRNLADILAPYFYALRATEAARREALIRNDIQAREEGLRKGALGLTEALERERQRIGMDLHDQTLADLTRIARDLTGEFKAVDTKQLQARVQECIQGLRDIIDTSIPSILELFGFQHAVTSHIERALISSPETKYEVVEMTEGAIEGLSNSVQISLFRITQEAINNAVEHANATRIEVKVASEPQEGMTITIRDDGSTMASNVKSKARGGIMHMRTRARLIGAEFDIRDDSGTCVSIRLPGNSTKLDTSAE